MDECSYGGESVGGSSRVEDVCDRTVGVVGLVNPGEVWDKLSKGGPD